MTFFQRFWLLVKLFLDDVSHFSKPADDDDDEDYSDNPASSKGSGSNAENIVAAAIISRKPQNQEKLSCWDQVGWLLFHGREIVPGVQKDDMEELMKSIRRLTVLVCLILSAGTIVWGVRRVGTVSQDSGIEFTQPKLDLYLYIEDLTWNASERYDLVTFGSPSSSEQEPAGIPENFCKSFYNSLGFADRANRMSDFLSTTFFLLFSQRMDYVLPMRDEICRRHPPQIRYDYNEIVENGVFLWGSFAPTGFNFTAKIVYRMPNNVPNPEDNSSSWLDFFPRPVLAINMKTFETNTFINLPQADTLKSHIVLVIPPIVASSRDSPENKKRWVFSVEDNSEGQRDNMPILPPLAEKRFFPLPIGKTKDNHILLNTKFAKTSHIPSRFFRQCMSDPSYSYYKCCRDHLRNHTRDYLRGEGDLQYLPWLAKSFNNITSDLLRYAPEQSDETTRPHGMNSRTRFQFCSQGRFSYKPSLLKEWCLAMENDSYPVGKVSAADIPCPDGNGWRKRVKTAGPDDISFPHSIEAIGDNSNPACQNQKWTSLLESNQQSLQRVKAAVKKAFGAFSSFECPCLRHCSSIDYNIVTVRDNSVPRPHLEYIKRIVTPEWEAMCQKASTAAAAAAGKDEDLNLNMDLVEQTRVTIHLSHKTDVTYQFVSYNDVMVVVELTNILGLLFGLSLLSVYESLESAFVKAQASTSPEQHQQGATNNEVSYSSLPKGNEAKTVESKNVVTAAVIKFRKACGHEMLEKKGTTPLALAWSSIWIAALVVCVIQGIQQYDYYKTEPVETVITTEIMSNLDQMPDIWVIRETESDHMAVDLNSIKDCRLNFAHESCKPIASTLLNETSSIEGFTNLTWITWKRNLQPAAFLTNFFEFYPNSRKFLIGNHKWLVMSSSKRTKSLKSEWTDVRQHRPEGPITTYMDIESENPDEALVVSAHMTPEDDYDKVQPFASLDDGKVLLRPGYSYSIDAKITRRRRLRGSHDRCTHDSRSINSWQVAKEAWVYAFMSMYGPYASQNPRSGSSSRALSAVDVCKLEWLIPAARNHSTSGQLIPQWAGYSSLPECALDIRGSNGSPLAVDSDEYRTRLSSVLRLEKTYLEVMLLNYSRSFMMAMPDKISTLLPCKWDTVTFVQVQTSLYSLSDIRKNRTRVTLTFHPDVETFEDSFIYGTISLLSNLFGLLGLYHGYGVLDVHEICEKLFLALLGRQTAARGGDKDGCEDEET